EGSWIVKDRVAGIICEGKRVWLRRPVRVAQTIRKERYYCIVRVALMCVLFGDRCRRIVKDSVASAQSRLAVPKNIVVKADAECKVSFVRGVESPIWNSRIPWNGHAWRRIRQNL